MPPPTDPDDLRRRVRDLEARLAEADRERAFLRGVLEHISPVVLRVALDGTIEYINRSPASYAARPPLGQSVYTYAAPEQVEATRAAIGEAIRTGAPVELDGVAVAPDGTRDWYHTVVAPIREDGAIVAVALSSTQITRVKQAEQELRERRERDALALDLGNVGVWRWDRVTDVVTWDDKLCSMFGVAPADAPATAEAFLALVSEDQRGAMRAHIEAAVATGVYLDFELRVDAPDGTRWLVIKGGATRDADGQVTGLLGGVVDDTERRRLVEAVREAQKLDAMGQLAAGVAHNFNNMLAGVVPVLSMARRSATPELAGYLRDAEQMALRAGDLVRDLMTLGRRGDEASPRPREALGTVLGRAVDLCRRTFSRHIAIDVAIDPAADQVAVDGVPMEQAILNLLLNARDALGEGDARRARIEVTATRVDVDAGITGRPWPAIEVRVRDNGCGMDAATRARVFDPFFTTKPVGAGTGLGLATAWATLNAHGGTLTCESTPGGGTTFWFRLLLDGGADAAATSTTTDDGDRVGRAGIRVLVIDDEDVVRRATSRLLQSRGYEVVSAASGADGVRAFAERPTDVVLLDHSMPGQGPAATLAQLRAVRPDVPVIVFSGLAVEVEGASGYVAKPATLEGLDRELQRALAAARR